MIQSNWRGSPCSDRTLQLHLEHDVVMERTTRIYRFVITVSVDMDHPAYDDPEWAADAAHGALTNEYGLRATYTDITEVNGTELDGSLDA